MKQKRAVVTGSAGFIGSHLVEVLVSRRYQVTILDNFCTRKKQNIEKLHGDKVDLVQASVIDPLLLSQVLHNIDHVFHLAGLPSVSPSIQVPSASHRVNVTGTFNVLLSARDNSVQKVIHASSSAVYGDTSQLPKREDITPNPQQPHAVTKVRGEHYRHVLKTVYGLDIVCWRYFNVYSPRQDLDPKCAAGIPRFIGRILRGDPPIIFGDGKQTRDFTFVKDAAEANVLSAESNATGVVNIGTGNRTSINDLSKLATKLLGRTIKAILWGAMTWRYKGQFS